MHVYLYLYLRVLCHLRFFTVCCDFDISLLSLPRILIVTKSKKSAAVMPALGSLHQTPVYFLAFRILLASVRRDVVAKATVEESWQQQQQQLSLVRSNLRQYNSAGGSALVCLSCRYKGNKKLAFALHNRCISYVARS